VLIGVHYWSCYNSASGSVIKAPQSCCKWVLIGCQCEIHKPSLSRLCNTTWLHSPLVCPANVIIESQHHRLMVAWGGKWINELIYAYCIEVVVCTQFLSVQVLSLRSSVCTPKRATAMETVTSVGVRSPCKNPLAFTLIAAIMINPNSSVCILITVIKIPSSSLCGYQFTQVVISARNKNMFNLFSLNKTS